MHISYLPPRFDELRLERQGLVAAFDSSVWGLKLRHDCLHMTKDARFWIEQLGLIPHPEGGYYRETYRSEAMIPKDALPAGFSGTRASVSAIYFLLAGKDFSALHRLRSDEMWHFYAGDALEVHVFDSAGEHSVILLGNDPGNGEALQAVVKAGCWFGSRLHKADSYALVGCTVSPGFDFEDFEMAERVALSARYPKHAELIRTLTRS